MKEQTIGPGTELKLLLRKVRIYATAECPCDMRALLMDEEGPDWCCRNIDAIVGWMREEAENRGLPFIGLLAKLLVLRAIRNARRKLRAVGANQT